MQSGHYCTTARTAAKQIALGNTTTERHKFLVILPRYLFHFTSLRYSVEEGNQFLLDDKKERKFSVMFR